MGLIKFFGKSGRATILSVQSACMYPDLPPAAISHSLQIRSSGAEAVAEAEGLLKK